MVKILKFGMVNTYLIQGSKGSILVDTGYKKNRKALIAQLENVDLKLIILTHGHIDHISNAKYIADKFGVPIAMHKDDYELVKDNSLRKIYSESILGFILKFFSEQEFKTPIEQFEPEIFLKDKECIKDYGIPIKVYELRGHTKGSIGLLIGDKEFIAGDALMNFISASRSRIFENKKEMINSVSIIKKLGVEKIYVGHGKVINATKFFDKLK